MPSPSKPVLATASSAARSESTGSRSPTTRRCRTSRSAARLRRRPTARARATRSLAASVSAFDLVRADGELVHLERGDDDFDAVVVGLGTLGLMARLTLELVPAFELRQTVFDDLPWATVEAHLHELLALGYSTASSRSGPTPASIRPGSSRSTRSRRASARARPTGRVTRCREQTRSTAPSSSACRGRRTSGCPTSGSGSRRAAATSSSPSTRSRASMRSTRCGRSARSGRS